MRGWLPAGGGLRDEDWTRRHRLLTLLLAVIVLALTVYGYTQDRLDSAWLFTVGLILPCVVGAVLLRPRRLPSIFVAVGLTIACGGFVAMSGGQTEAHFAFFIAIAALALYRDWTPFCVFLVGTTLHHAVFGALVAERTYDHHSAVARPWLWAVVHGCAVLAAATFQVVAWRLTEAEERRAQDSLAASQAQLSVAFDETPVPMAMIAPDGGLLRVNSAFRGWLGLPEQLAPGYSLADLPVTPEGTETGTLIRQLMSAPDATTTITQAYRRHDDGSLMWVETHSNGLRDRRGRIQSVFLHCLDVTRQQEHEAALRRQVRQDSLTGLLSRSAFEVDLVELLGASDGPVSVLYLDVDRFKAINDGSGHSAGDDVLRALAARLELTVPRGSVIARLGGDEFVVAHPGPVASGLETGRAVLASLAQPLPVTGGRLQLAVSIGLALAHRPEQAEQAVLAADTAMYAAKRAGGNRLEIFNDEMRVAVQQRITAESRLRQALDGDRVATLPVWFQPIVSPATGLIVGAEALVRMWTTEGELLAPGHFIPTAEETGLVVPLGEHVLAEALRHLHRWRHELGYVSVNVSPRQLSEPDFVPKLARMLAVSGLDDPSRLVLEITETALLSNSLDLRNRLHAIKALGVRIALDDFGTGYSSLTWLQSVPADIVKLDRSFVAGLADDTRKASIISAVLWLAHSLNMSVVAEGVEDLADWEALRAAECPAIQGYFFSPPVTADDFHQMLTPARGVTLEAA
ncbi:putative bifunctional diguanylate cyclase/phosphodiesterase [Amorphoplanes digitatis]|uniref:Diguanylate cyclase (GGDEF)-like protein/PAS domain S-box-containing protein n=1 Tax=Actinoplanes digitatis TaxID=1868 RepID=A0A7W7MQJ1_9ACTN|nr:EAL domain-containing protein [Actinoplanes digitatis]MBB4762757.1 diguanylate cyclase (GGDEF)-like protein/PAS domain S-box-containing protein [Actinoplanes digitatis]BFE71672.1 EAL domain-containing protein [Actinoplanes digitatis]GID91747.1 bifunctional diguanylate cyclase/phosphodiesterase [Actinoplanes digitatis]